MTIREDGVEAISVGDLLDLNLQVPHYQRPYSWTPAIALQLLHDIKDALDNTEQVESPYVLGAVILYQQHGNFDIVDGQQRLLTLRMILMQLDPEDAPVAAFDLDNPVSRVWSALQRRIKQWPADVSLQLLLFVRTRCQLVKVVTDDIDEAFRVFDSQNYRGKPLAPHDLLKAHHLREMRGESPVMKAAVVEAWESVRDTELDRLFSVYLYRIARWSRGESAPGFTAHDIDMFKGVTRTQHISPSARYHLAAQESLPMLNAWKPEAGGSYARDAGRSQFQLDAPILAGRTFFDMVTFMLAELHRLRRDAYPDPWASFASSNAVALDEIPARSRYRKVSELYVAALLYYTNKFGDEDLRAVRERLFAWAYGPRVSLLRVQNQSVDNLASGKDGRISAFTLLRNAPSGRVVDQLPGSTAPYTDDHESELVALLKELNTDD